MFVSACARVCACTPPGTCMSLHFCQRTSFGSLLFPPVESVSFLFLLPCVLQASWPMSFWVILLLCLPSCYRSAGNLDTDAHCHIWGCQAWWAKTFILSHLSGPKLETCASVSFSPEMAVLEGTHRGHCPV